MTAIRSVRAEMNVPPATQAPLVASGANALTMDRLKRHDAALRRLARLSSIEITDDAPKNAVQMPLGEAALCLPLGGLIDIAAETARLGKELARNASDMGKVSAKLANERFVASAKPEIVEAERARFDALQAEKRGLEQAMARLAGL